MTLLASATPISHRAPVDRVAPLLRWGKWAVLALAAMLYTWALGQNGYANDYYAAAIYSGTQSWKAFFFGALDAGSYITLDKPPFALWVMGLSARIFGFGTWSMLLPQAAAGVASVALVHSAVRRALRGLGTRAAGTGALLAALVMALTPITVAINRDNNPDTILVLLLVAAGWCCLEAIRTGRLRTLLMTALLVGLAFNTKMLQAYLVLPAFALTYLYAAPGAFVRRIGRLLAAGVVLVVSSAWWMVVVDLMPASSRPYVGGSTNNTVGDLVIGYNGLGRLFGGSGNRGGGGRLPGDAVDGMTRAFGGGPGGGGGGGFGGASGAGRLFNDVLAGQISRLLPFVAVALVCGLVLVARPAFGPARDTVRASLLVWGGWLLVHYVVFSFSSGTFHPYYTTAMAPAIAALTGIGGVLMWRAARVSAAWRLVLAAAVAVTGAWSFVVLRRTPEFVPWLVWAVAGATAVAVLALAVTALAGHGTGSGTGGGAGSEGPAGRGGRTAARVTAVALTAAVAAGLAGPAAYAVTPLGSAVNGSNPTAGPSQGRGGPSGRGGPGGMSPGTRPGGATAPDGTAPEGAAPGGGAAPDGNRQSVSRQGGRGMRGPGGQVDAAMTAYLKKNKGSATWLVAVDSAQSASSLILPTGEPVIAMGGFTGSDPAMTVDKLERYVAEGELKYILVGGGFGPSRGASSEVTEWVQAHGTPVEASEYGGTDGGGSSLYKLG